jgi:chemotaxis-related protein WspD
MNVARAFSSFRGFSMATELEIVRQEPAVVNDCWNRIGVKGDGSCPELAKVIHCHNCPVFAAAGQHLLEREPPAEFVEEWTRALARPETAAPGETVAVLIFRIGAEWLALDVRFLVEVALMRVIRRVPERTNRMLLGLVNIRGELQPCVALTELLSIETAAGPGERLLIVGDPPRQWAFAVDEVAGVERLPLRGMGNIPSSVAHSRAHFSQGILCWDDKRIGYLTADRIFEALRKRIG